MRRPPRLLVAEFTEYVCIENESAFRAVVHELHKLGIHVSLDDFGNGYSSLNVLSSMDFDEVKLDKGFLKGSTLSLKDRRLIRSILRFIQGQEIRTVAEDVETKERLEVLQSILRSKYSMAFTQPFCACYIAGTPVSDRIPPR